MKKLLLVMVPILLILIFIYCLILQTNNEPSVYMNQIYSPLAVDSTNEVYYLKRIMNYKDGSPQYKIVTMLGIGTPSDQKNIEFWLGMPFIGKPQIVSDEVYICRNNIDGTAEDCPSSFSLPTADYPKYNTSWHQIQEQASLKVSDFLLDSEGNVYFDYTVNSSESYYKEITVATGPFAVFDIVPVQFKALQNDPRALIFVPNSNWEFTGNGNFASWEFRSVYPKGTEQESVVYIKNKTSNEEKAYLDLSKLH